MIYRYIEDTPAIIPLKDNLKLSICDGLNSLFCVFDSDILQSAEVTVSPYLAGDQLECYNDGTVDIRVGGGGSICNFVVEEKTVSEIENAMRFVKFRSGAESTGTQRTFQYVVDGQVHVETIVAVYNNANDPPEMSDLPQRSLFMMDEHSLVSTPVLIATTLIIIDADADVEVLALDPSCEGVLGFTEECTTSTTNDGFVAGVVNMLPSTGYGTFDSEDRLEVALPENSNISAQYDIPSGMLEFQGLASRMEYQNAFRQVKFSTMSAVVDSEGEAPTRSVQFRVHDGFVQSAEMYWARTSVQIVSRVVGFNITVENSVSAEDGQAAVVRIGLVSPPEAPVLIAITVSDGSEATADPAFAVLTTGNYENGVKVWSRGKSDNLLDGDVPYNILATVMITNDKNYMKILTTGMPLTNLDDPANALAVEAFVDSGTCQTNEDGAESIISVRVLNWNPAIFHTVRVSVQSSNYAEGSLRNVETNLATVDLEFTLEDVASFITKETIVKQFAVKGVDDFKADNAQPFSVTFSGKLWKLRDDGVSQALSSQSLFPQQLTAAIPCSNADNDVPGFEFLTGEHSALDPRLGCISGIADWTDEGGSSCTYGIRLKTEPYYAITLETTTPVGSNFLREGLVVQGDVLTIDSTNWNQINLIVVEGQDDDETDGDQSYNLQVGGVLGSVSVDAAYNGYEHVQSMTNEDMDIAWLKVETKDGVGISRYPFHTDETGLTQKFQTRLTEVFVPTSDVVITVTTADLTESAIRAADLCDANGNIMCGNGIPWEEPVEVQGAYPPIQVGTASVYVDGVGGNRVVTAIGPQKTSLHCTGACPSVCKQSVFEVVDLQDGTKQYHLRCSQCMTCAEVTIPEDTGVVKLIFTPENYFASQWLDCYGVDDEVEDGDVTGIVVMLDLASDDPVFNGKTFRFSIMNLDDDGLVTDKAIAQVAESGTTDTFVVQIPPPGSELNADVQNLLRGQIFDPVSCTDCCTDPAACKWTIITDVQVDVASTNPSEFTVSPAHFSFDSLNWAQSVNLLLSGVDDEMADGDVISQLQFTPTISYTEGANSGTKATAPFERSVQNKDDDIAKLIVERRGGASIEEGGNTVYLTDEAQVLEPATVAVVLGSEPLFDVVVPFQSSDDNEGNPEPDTVTFTKSNWNQEQIVTIQGVNDAIDDGDKDYTISIQNIQTDDAIYAALTASLDYRNIDDDAVGVKAYLTDNGFNKFEFTPENREQFGTTTEWGSTAKCLLTLLSQPTDPVLFAISSTNMMEGFVTPSLSVLAADNWNYGTTITVTGTDDLLNDGDQQFGVRVVPMISQDVLYEVQEAIEIPFTNKDQSFHEARILVNPVVGVTMEDDVANRAAAMANGEKWTGALVVTVRLSDWHTGEREFERFDITVMTTNNLEGKLISSNGALMDELKFTIDETNWETGIQFNAIGIDDIYYEPNDRACSFVVHSKVKIANDDFLHTVAPKNIDGPVMVTNINNDFPKLTVVDTKEAETGVRCETTETGDECSLRVTFATPPAGAGCQLPVQIMEVVGAEGEVVGAVAGVLKLTITEANWLQIPDIVVKGKDDEEADDTQVFTVLIGPAVCADSDYNGQMTNVTMSNLDNDARTLLVVQCPTDPEGQWVYQQDGTCPKLSGQAEPVDETGSERKIGVMLPSEPTHDVVVDLTVTNDGQTSQWGSLDKSSLTFTKDNYDQLQYIYYTGMDNDAAGSDSGGQSDLSQRFTVTFLTNSDDTGFDNQEWSFVVANYDDEIVRLDKTTCAVSEAGTSCVMNIMMNKILEGPLHFTRVDMTFEVTDDTEAAVTTSNAQDNTKLVFTSTELDAAKDGVLQKDFQILGLDDFVDDGDIEFQVILKFTLTYWHSFSIGACTSIQPCQKDIKNLVIAVTNQNDDTASMIMQQQYMITDPIVITEDDTVIPINGADCPVQNVLVVGQTCDQEAPKFDAEGTICANDGTPEEAYCTFSEGDTACVRCAGLVRRSNDNEPPGGMEGSLVNIWPPAAPFEVAPIVLNEKMIAGSATYGYCWIRFTSEPVHTLIVPLRVNLDEHERVEAQIVAPQSRVITVDKNNWDKWHVIRLVGTDDNIYDGDSSYTVSIGPVQSLDPKFAGLESELTGTTIDDDEIGLILEMATDAAGNVLSVTSEDGSQIGSLRAKLGSEPKTTVLFTTTASIPAEAMTNPSIVAFSPDNWDIFQTITVTGQDDLLRDGDKNYFVKVATLFTDDPDYGADAMNGGMLEAQKPFVNLDDAFDRSIEECMPGQYGNNEQHDCERCPEGTFLQSTKQTSSRSSCIPCFAGTYSDVTGAYYDILKVQAGEPHPCKPCPDGTYQPYTGQTTCYKCPDGLSFCPCGTGRPGIVNITAIDDDIVHTWDILKEATFSEQWSVMGMYSFMVNEATLQLFTLFGSIMVLVVVVACCGCVNCCSKAALIEEKAWRSAKSSMRGLDGFMESHARYITEANEMQPKATLIGGFATVAFLSLSWCLVGIVMFLFLQFNESVVQSLVPKSSTDHIRMNLKATVEFLGYTGPCPVVSSIASTGATSNPLGKELDTKERECYGGDGLIAGTRFAQVGTGFCASNDHLPPRHFRSIRHTPIQCRQLCEDDKRCGAYEAVSEDELFIRSGQLELLGMDVKNDPGFPQILKSALTEQWGTQIVMRVRVDGMESLAGASKSFTGVAHPSINDQIDATNQHPIVYGTAVTYDIVDASNAGGEPAALDVARLAARLVELKANEEAYQSERKWTPEVEIYKYPETSVVEVNPPAFPAAGIGHRCHLFLQDAGTVPQATTFPEEPGCNTEGCDGAAINVVGFIERDQYRAKRVIQSTIVDGDLPQGYPTGCMVEAGKYERWLLLMLHPFSHILLRLCSCFRQYRRHVYMHRLQRGQSRYVTMGMSPMPSQGPTNCDQASVRGSLPGNHRFTVRRSTRNM
jgi:hypothetical protein